MPYVCQFTGRKSSFGKSRTYRGQKIKKRLAVDAVDAELVRQQAVIADVDAIITTGGTGLTSRDSTFEAIDALLTKRLPGFGELFRMLSYEQIGSAAMMSRACAGTIGKVVVISLPGSEKAVRIAMTKLVIPELAHLVQQATK